MGRFCDECNQEIGFFSKRKVELPDGVTRVVCKSCAPLVRSRYEDQRRGAAVPAPSPGHGTHQQASSFGQMAPPDDRKAFDAVDAAADTAALEALEAKHREDPSSIAVASELGKVSLRLAEATAEPQRQEHADRAMKCYRSLLLQGLDETSSPSKAEVFYGLALGSKLQGDHQKARQMVERALQQDPNMAQARSLLDELGS